MERSELNLDAALTALARESHDASPRPGADMMATVMADAAVSMLAREAADAVPWPTSDLVARVLADAAEIGAANAAANTHPAARPTANSPALAGRRLRGLLFGWRAGAIAAMGLALAIGAGIGFEMEPGSLPVLDRDSAGQQVALASLGGDLLDVDGL